MCRHWGQRATEMGWGERAATTAAPEVGMLWSSSRGGGEEQHKEGREGLYAKEREREREWVDEDAAASPQTRVGRERKWEMGRISCIGYAGITYFPVKPENSFLHPLLPPTFSFYKLLI